MNEVLTLEEMETRFPSEWVLIGDPLTEEGPRLLGGRVILHSPDRDAVHRKAIELRLPDFAVWFLGPLPEGMELVL